MKYIKNNTDNVIVVKCISEGKEKKLVFPKKSVTEVTDEMDSIFNENPSYAPLFTNETLTYTVKEAEVYKDDFTNYLKSWSFNAEEGTLTLNFKEILKGETVYLKFSRDSGDVEETTFNVPAELTFTATVGTIIGFFDFRLYNDYYNDYPIAYSNRVKVYK